MGKQWEKYLKKIGGNIGYKVKDAVRDILRGNLDHLDIKKLAGEKNLLRCRVGEIRIIFKEIGEGKYEIVKIKPRGDV